MKRHDAEERSHKGSPLFGVALALVFASAAFFSGIEIGAHRAVSSKASGAANEAFLGLFSSKQQSDIDMGEFWRVWELLDSKFVKSTTTATSTEVLTDTEKVQGAIGGLVDAFGDPYTIYLPPADAEIFESDIAGNFQGVGMEIGIQDDILTVIAPLPETPAEKAGVRAGDKLVKIDDQVTDGMSVDEAVKKIRGEKGTTVKLTVFREGATELLEIPVVRDVINIPTSKVEERDGVFIVRLYNFSALSEARMQEALRAFMKSGGTKLVIDLRGNPGGYLQSAVNIASYFLPMGKPVVRESYGGDTPEDVYRSQGRDLHQYRDFETIVLVDGGSASASEILAGALQEHGVAKLVGAKTFGKGSVQELVELESGASLKVTIARWLTPNGNSISHTGIEPDVAVPVTDEDRTAGKDPQLEKAIQMLNE
ncbi:MAG: carboxy-terminal-processing protease, carboxyl-terminal processing protease [Candidatus Parcubacteria bacterium]